MHVYAQHVLNKHSLFKTHLSAELLCHSQIVFSYCKRILIIFFQGKSVFSGTFFFFFNYTCMPPVSSCSDSSCQTGIYCNDWHLVFSIYKSQYGVVSRGSLPYLPPPNFQLGICYHLTLISDFWNMQHSGEQHSNGELIVLCQMSYQLIDRVYPVHSSCMFSSYFLSSLQKDDNYP